MTRPHRIAVVGGGIAGLTLASALDPDRFDVTLYEAQPDRADTGSALGLWQSAQRALRKAGVEVDSQDPASLTGGALHDIRGRRLIGMRGTGPAMVDRPALLAALTDAVPTTVVREEQEVADPEALDADLIVGADGVRSRVRGLVEPRAADRVRTPYVALRGIRSGTADHDMVGEYWGEGLLFGQLPVSRDRTYWFTTHWSELEEPLDGAAALAEARERFAGAAPVIEETLAGAGDDTLATRIWKAPPMSRYARGRYVVIGDAAHAMTPNLGRGACSAIVDAVTLADALKSGADIRRWQARRVPATQAARVASSAAMRLALNGVPLVG